MDNKLHSKYIDVLNEKMHYLEIGQGSPILFLHDIPTSSHAWRKVMPYLSSLGRCIAPDLIGFGKSAKPEIDYTVHDHIRFIDKFIEAMQLTNLVIVMHGWGSVIGFDYAMRQEKNCRGLVFYESFLRSFDGNDLSLPFQEQLSSFQQPEDVGDLTMSGISFVDKMIPQYTMYALSEADMAIYREPFKENGTAKPIMQYLKEMPKGDGKSEIDKFIAHYSMQLAHSELPKLLLYTVPGFVTTMATIMWAKENLPNLEIIDIGEELHLAQETSPQVMGETISVWLQGVEHG